MLVIFNVQGQDIISLDTANFMFYGDHLIEQHEGKRAVYVKGGSITLKNTDFLNGTIEFDMFLKEAHSFPGVMFRMKGNDAEQFFVRPHLSGKPDANQAAPLVQGITPFQLNFGPTYSFAYEYKFDDWTHVKLIVNDRKAQIFLDDAASPHLSWELFHEPQAGAIVIRGGNAKAIHIANVSVDESAVELVDFKPIERAPIEDLIQEWEISDMFEEDLLDDPSALPALIKARKWNGSVVVEEGTAANISRIQNLYNGEPGNTVFAKVVIDSDVDQLSLLEFGYSDRVVVILNGQPIYKGTTKWRSRDYRYLGTVGLFDAVYLNLKKGSNELLLAVSEEFGGWLVTGRIADQSDLGIR